MGALAVGRRKTSRRIRHADPYNATRIHHPALQGRQLVLVGDHAEATAWARQHDIDVAHAVIVSGARELLDLTPDRVHLIVLPSARDWRRPHYFLLRTELNAMHARGATVEWA